MKAEKAQDPQPVLADALRRVPDEPHAPRAQIGQPAERVDHRAVGLGIERIHREIAAPRIGLEALAEGDLRVAAIGLDIGAEGRDLVGQAARHHGHGAMRDPRRHRLEPRRLRARHHRFGGRIRGDVDIADRLAEQRVAHAAADEQRPVPRPGQRRADRARLGPVDPRAVEPHARPARSASPRRIRAVAPQM